MPAAIGHVVVAYLWSAAVMTSSLSGADDADFRSVGGRLRTVLEYSVEEEVAPGTLIGKSNCALFNAGKSLFTTSAEEHLPFMTFFNNIANIITSLFTINGSANKQ